MIGQNSAKTCTCNALVSRVSSDLPCSATTTDPAVPTESVQRRHTWCSRLGMLQSDLRWKQYVLFVTGITGSVQFVFDNAVSAVHQVRQST